MRIFIADGRIAIDDDGARTKNENREAMEKMQRLYIFPPPEFLEDRDGAASGKMESAQERNKRPC